MTKAPNSRLVFDNFRVALCSMRISPTRDAERPLSGNLDVRYGSGSARTVSGTKRTFRVAIQFE